MKGTLHKTEKGWHVINMQATLNGPLLQSLPLIDNGHIDGLKLYDSNEGLEVEFEIVSNEGEPLGKGEQPYKQYAKLAKIITPEEDKTITKCYCGHTSYCDCGPLPEEDSLKDWDVTLMDGLENEPYVSDDFQIGPDGAYEHTKEWNTLPREKAKELVDKFSNECLLTIDGSKVAALIAVNEIKTVLYTQDSMIRYDYWYEVKKEIHKM